MAGADAGEAVAIAGAPQGGDVDGRRIGHLKCKTIRAVWGEDQTEEVEQGALARSRSGR